MLMMMMIVVVVVVVMVTTMTGWGKAAPARPWRHRQPASARGREEDEEGARQDRGNTIALGFKMPRARTCSPCCSSTATLSAFGASSPSDAAAPPPPILRARSPMDSSVSPAWL